MCFRGFRRGFEEKVKSMFLSWGTYKGLGLKTIEDDGGEGGVIKKLRGSWLY